MAIYKINVAKIIQENIGKPFGPYHQHYFAIDKDCRMEEAYELVQDLKSRFPESEFKISCSRWESSGTQMNW
jgi:hypothetical protein